MFGASQQQSSGRGLFGSPNKPSLFGSSTTAQPQQQGTSLFGSLGTSQQQQPQQQQPQQQQQGPSLFGSTLNKPAQTPSLFGASQPQQQTSGIFTAPNQTQPSSLFAGSRLAPQNTIFGNPTQSTLRPAPVWQPGSSVGPREKSIPEQMQILLEKWSPESPNCLFQYYFYNNVRPEEVPYYGPAPGEDEKKWEEALSKKPGEGSIPVLAKGFMAVGERLTIQVKAVQALQARLHEINNSLTAMMQKHDLEIATRTADARRKHTALSQRCLALAAKVQVLRNRGYAMDSTEEELKKKLMQLERRAFDPVLTGRQEEIWARMSGVRARAKMLQEESERLGQKLASGEEATIDETAMKSIKQLLSDFDSQLTHLKKELDQIRKDYELWQDNKDGPHR